MDNLRPPGAHEHPGQGHGCNASYFNPFDSFQSVQHKSPAGGITLSVDNEDINIDEASGSFILSEAAGPWGLFQNPPRPTSP
jgi:hypothetical protein